jgi:hypothetical protein
LQEDIKVKQEAALWSKEKAELRKEFRSIQKEVSSSLVMISPDFSVLGSL